MRESDRLHALTQLRLLNSPPSESFDRITRMAAQIFDLPIAAVSLTDNDRQWFKSRVGIDHWEIPRDRAPCSEVATAASMLVIPDLMDDDCYRESVLAKSGIRFYAGAPLVTRDGFGLGAMCVLGTSPRTITASESAALTDLAAMVMSQIELRHAFGRVEPVSGLPNRHQFAEDLQDQARDDPRGFRSLILSEMIDLVRFSDAARVLGHGALDEFIRDVGRILQERLGPDMVVYQVGSSEFAWLIRHRNAASARRALATLPGRMEADIRSRPFPSLANPVAGMAPFRLGDVEADVILRQARSAAQEARKAGGLVACYSPSADAGHQRRFQFVSDIREAITATDQLSLVYQPKICLTSGACVGVEALLRWRHPVLGNVSPAEFIPTVERTDLAGPLTDWVVDAALAQAREWKAALPISVNVSTTNLEEHNFATRFVRKLEDAGLPPSALEIEVTEGAMIRDGTCVTQQLIEIRKSGIKVSIDDFGTGYSSLSYLQNLPADVVKIDQSFIRDLGSNTRNRTLVQSMITMAQSLDFRVVAEGVEDDVALEILKSWSCDEAQGYFFSRPVPAAALNVWIADRLAA